MTKNTRRPRRPTNQGIQAAIDAAGGCAPLAERLRRDSTVVYRYLHGQMRVPVSVALAMEADDKLRVPRWKTRPDVWEVGE